MGILEDIMKTLERIPAWKRLQAVPKEIEALEERVKALETRLAPAQGDQCPKCRAMAFQLMSSDPAPPPFGRLGVMQDKYQCSSCNYSDTRQRGPER